MSSFDSISDILRKLQARNPALSKRIQEADALSRWDLAVGAAISKHTRAIRIQDSVLWIEVDHPVWKTELHYRKRQILDLLNQVQLPTKSTSSPKPTVDLKSSESKNSPDVIKDILFLDGRARKE
jgi:predicted nucleic acid-binding Zn ribbon protein